MPGVYPGYGGDFGKDSLRQWVYKPFEKGMHEELTKFWNIKYPLILSLPRMAIQLINLEVQPLLLHQLKDEPHIQEKNTK